MESFSVRKSLMGWLRRRAGWGGLQGYQDPGRRGQAACGLAYAGVPGRKRLFGRLDPPDLEQAAQGVSAPRLLRLPLAWLVGAEDAVPQAGGDAEVVLPQLVAVVQVV